MADARLDADTDLRLHRAQLMAAIQAANPKALGDVLTNVAPSAATLEAEVGAAKAVVELLSKLESTTEALATERTRVEELRANGAAAATASLSADGAAKQAAAQHQAEVAQLRAQLNAAKNGAPPTSDTELTAVAQETRINELQAVIVSLQTQLRQAEMRGQQTALELANSKESVGPTLKAMRSVEDDLAHTQRLLRTSEASNSTLLTQIASLQQRASGVAISEARPPKPPPHPTVPSQLESPSKAPALAAPPPPLAAPPPPPADDDDELPTTLEELQGALRHEKARVRLMMTEVSAVREESEHQFERQRRGADRGLREMQTEFARLHKANAEMREAVNAAEGRAAGEASFRKRAEQGWLAAQQSLERTNAELQQGGVQIGELKGQLSAAQAVSAELESAKRRIEQLQGGAAMADARLGELLESQKLSSQQVAVAMGHAQQHAASEYDRLQAEHDTTHQAIIAESRWWRVRAEKASARCAAAASALSASRSSLESLLSRLVTASSVADLADQSRMLFEVKAALIDVEDKLRRPDSAGGPPGTEGKGKGRRRAEGGATGPGAGASPTRATRAGGAAAAGLSAANAAISASQPALQLPGIGSPFATTMAVGGMPPGSLAALGQGAAFFGGGGAGASAFYGGGSGLGAGGGLGRAGGGVPLSPLAAQLGGYPHNLAALSGGAQQPADPARLGVPNAPWGLAPPGGGGAGGPGARGQGPGAGGGSTQRQSRIPGPAAAKAGPGARPPPADPSASRRGPASRNQARSAARSRGAPSAEVPASRAVTFSS